MSVGDYRDLIEHVGSPREFLAGLQFNSQAAAEADQILVDENPLEVEPGACPNATNVPASGLSVAPGSTVSVQSIDQSVQVFVVRFGDLTFGLPPVVTLDLGDAVLLSLPDDDIPVPWTIKGTSGAVLTLC